MVWVDGEAGGVRYQRSLDGGASFRPERGLGPERSIPGVNARGVRVLANGERVYVTWLEGGLRFRSSSDRGETFGPVLELTQEREGGLSLAATTNHVYMGWFRSSQDERGGIHFVRSPTGSVFEEVEELSGSDYGDVVLAAQGAHVYVLWNGSGGDEKSSLFFRRSTDGGRTFEPPQQLSGLGESSRDHTLTVQGTDVYAVWTECGTGLSTCEILLRKSTNAGRFFGPVVNVSRDAKASTRPQVVARDSRLFVAWQDLPLEALGPDIVLTMSVDGGFTFEEPRMVSRTRVQSLSPRMVAAGAGVRLVWTDGFNGEREVMTRATVGLGLSLGRLENLSISQGDSGEAAMASSYCGAQVHVAWLEGNAAQGNAVLYRSATLPFPGMYCLMWPEPR
ncbi:BNR/Asp-box repeat domain protein [Myxococcus hansupus]|uniref:BNR/Asp-box repeat domain protein n=1 Tax=Pseudomyxococcus hansupus TaxID=1297742 RepID=A0A0H4X8F6_9BACT|nr:BNR/Asp-box repeat domain protein [Myxococcus hansupus]